MTHALPRSKGFGAAWFPSIFFFEGGPRKLQLKVPVLQKFQVVATHSSSRWFNAKNTKVMTKGKNNIFLNQSHRPLLTRPWGFCISLISDGALAYSPDAIHHGRGKQHSTCLRTTLPEQMQQVPGSHWALSPVASAAGSTTRSRHKTRPWGTSPSTERTGKPPRAGKHFCQALKDAETDDASLQIVCKY